MNPKKRTWFVTLWAIAGAVIGFLGGGALLTVLGAAYGGSDGGQFGMIGFLFGPSTGFFLGWRLAARRFVIGVPTELERGIEASPYSDRQAHDGEVPGHEERWVWALTGIPIGGILGCVSIAAGAHIVTRLHFTNPWNNAWMMPFSWAGLLLGLAQGPIAGWLLAGLRAMGSHEPPGTDKVLVPKDMMRRVLRTLIILVGIMAVPYVLALVNVYLFVVAGLCAVLVAAVWTGRVRNSAQQAKPTWFQPRWPYLAGVGETLLMATVFMLLPVSHRYATPLSYFLCLSIFPVLNAAKRQPYLVRGNIMGAALLVGMRALLLVIWMVGMALGYADVP